jgi:hypothetical protein
MKYWYWQGEHSYPGQGRGILAEEGNNGCFQGWSDIRKWHVLYPGYMALPAIKDLWNLKLKWIWRVVNGKIDYSKLSTIQHVWRIRCACYMNQLRAWGKLLQKKNLSGIGPLANYADRPLLVGEVVSTFADRGCCVVSPTDPPGR